MERTVNCLVHLICKHLKWKSMVFFSDSTIYDNIINQVVKQLQVCNMSIITLIHYGGLHKSEAFQQLWNISFASPTLRVVVWAPWNVVTSLFQKKSQYFMCHFGHHWLVVPENSSFLSLESLAMVHCHFAVLQLPLDGATGYQSLSSKEESSIVGRCQDDGSYFPLENVYNEKQSFRLNANNFVLTIEKHFPFFIPPTGGKLADGVDIKLIDMLSEKLNFSYVIKQPHDKKWGALINGSWNGMIGLVVRKEADAALGGMTVSVDRLEAVDFSSYYSFDRLTFATRAPQEADRTWIIILPFSWKVWVTLGFAVIFTSMTLTLLEEGKVRIYVSTNVHSKEQKKIPYRTILFYTFKPLVNQECIETSSNATRIMIALWFVFTITAVSGYSGTLISFMTYPGTTEPMDNVQKLVTAVKKGKYQCGTMKDSSDHNIFKTEQAAEFKILLKNMESRASNFVANDKAGLAKSLLENYAYIAGELTVYADMENPKLYIFAQDGFRLSGYAVAFSKDFWYKEAFNVWILRIQQSGVVDLWIRQLIEPTQVIQMPPATGRPLTMDDLQGAFWVMLIGYAAASASMLVTFLALFGHKFILFLQERIFSKPTEEI